MSTLSDDLEDIQIAQRRPYKLISWGSAALIAIIAFIIDHYTPLAFQQTDYLIQRDEAIIDVEYFKAKLASNTISDTAEFYKNLKKSQARVMHYNEALAFCNNRKFFFGVYGLVLLFIVGSLIYWSAWSIVAKVLTKRWLARKKQSA